jgi:hypothetical protein
LGWSFAPLRMAELGESGGSARNMVIVLPLFGWPFDWLRRTEGAKVELRSLHQ